MTSIVVTNPSTTVVVSETEVTITVTDSGVVLSVAQGQAGIGVPSGGLTGEVLTKVSNADYDTEWAASDLFWDSPTLQVLIFNGAENPNVETDPLRTHFVTTYGSWVGIISPATTPVNPTGIGGSVTYINNTCVLSTNPTATVGNSRAEMRQSKPNIGPQGSDATSLFDEHAWHLKIDAEASVYVPETLYLLGYYRSHAGSGLTNLEHLFGFIAISGIWHIQIYIDYVLLLDFSTGVSVTERHTFEVIQQQANVSEVYFKIDGVLIDCGFTTWTDYWNPITQVGHLRLHAGAAIRDDNTPQTEISSLTIYEMVLKCKAITGVLPHTHPTTDLRAGLAIQNDVVTFKTVGGWSYEQPKIGQYFMQIGTALERQNLQFDGTNWVNRKDSFYNTRHTDHSLSSSTAVQNVFHTPNDTIALDANSVWMFEGSYVIAAGSITHTTAIGFSEFGNGSCHFDTLTAGITAYGGVQRAQDMSIFNNSFGGPINTTTTSAHVLVRFSGRITVVDATNFVPTLRFSAAPTGTCAVKSGSWIKLTRLWTGESVSADPEWT